MNSHAATPKTMLSRLTRRFVRDSRGLSAVEFALVLPFMLTLYLGCVEVSQAIAANRKVTLVSRTVADLVSQVSSINTAGVDDVLNASSAIMVPFSVGSITVTVSSITIDPTGKATIDWSDTLTGTVRSSNTVHAKGAAVTFPAAQAALKVNDTSLIWSEVNYTYAPMFGSGLVSAWQAIGAWTGIDGVINLHDQIYMRPRVSKSVQRT